MKKKLNLLVLFGAILISSSIVFGKTTPQPTWKIETIKLKLAPSTIGKVLDRAQLRMNSVQRSVTINKPARSLKMEQLKK